MNLKFNYQVPILEQGLIDNDFIIQGTAISVTTTSNGHKFLAEELKPSAKTLTGVPLLKNHTNEVESIMGRVLKGMYMDEEKRVEFKAKVVDKVMQTLIKDGRLNSVSVGLDVKDIEEDGDYLIPRGITFRELSLVAVGADEDANFEVALKQAYDTKKSDLSLNKKKPIGEEKMGKDEIKKEIKKTEEKAKEDVKESKVEKTEEKFTKDDVKKMVSEAVDKALKAKEADEDEKEDKEEEDTSKDSEKDSEDKKEDKTEDDDSKEDSDDDSDESDEGDDDATEEKGHKFVQESGTLRGGSFTLVRE